MKAFVEPSAEDWWEGRSQPMSQLPADLENCILIGHPETVPQMKPLLAKAGVTVVGSKATYKGTSIDINKGAVVGVVESAPGKWTGFRVGVTRRDPNVGNAQVAMVDEYGRFLRGQTLPRTNGPLVIEVK